MRNTGLVEAQARRDINNLRNTDDTTLRAESDDEIKRLDESERGEWKSWLKTQPGIQSCDFMANRWENSGNSRRLYFWAPKSLQMVTAAMKLKDAYSLAGKLYPAKAAY